MKRLLVAATALIASLAIGLATVSATAGAAGGAAQIAKKKKKKVKKFAATISLTIQKTAATTYSPGSGTYSGAVSSGGPAACRSGRAVTISGPTPASATTAADGSYSVTVNTAPGAGQYVASVPTVVIKKKGKKKKCLGATSAPVTVP